MMKWMLLVPLVLSMVACLSDDEHGVPSSAVDDKEFVGDQFIDSSVRPGNDFYRYAVGGWLNDDSHIEPYATQTVQALKDALQQVAASGSDPVVSSLRSLIAQSVNDNMTDALQTKELLERIDRISTQKELLTVFAELQQLGYQPLVRLAYTVSEGTIKGCLSIGSIPVILKTALMNEGKGRMRGVIAEQCSSLMHFGFSTERYLEVFEHAFELEQMELNAFQAEIDVWQRPRAARLRTAARSPQFDALYELLGIDLSQELMEIGGEHQEALEEIVELLMDGSEESIALVRDYLLYHVIAHDGVFLPGYGPASNEADMLLTALEYVRYYQYRLCIETYGKEQVHKQECNRILEEYRVMLASRIEKLDWMSSSTKQEAQKKLQAMKFYIGYPDQWNEAFTPKVEGTTLLQAVTGLRQQSMQFVRKLIGTDMLQNGWDYYASLMPVTLQNAMYDETSNTLIILPCFLCAPAFDTTQSDAHLYGAASVFGHEMTHGFDSKGASYDEHGVVRDWWTAADKAAFQTKQQQLVQLFNQLDAYPGQKANGEMTLAENMADYAGVTLAFECYKQRLVQQGFTGETYNEQLRKFWLSYANVWLTDDELSEEQLIEAYLEDEHSAAHNRLNGIVRLFDEWYDLYDVQPTDALYLKPEERVKIW